MKTATPAGSPSKRYRKINVSLRSFIGAVLFIGVLILFAISGVRVSSFLARNSQNKEIIVKEKSSATIPADIPVYTGAVLAEVTSYGNVSIFQYVMPQGSLESVHAFYETEMAKNNWSRQPLATQLNDIYISGDRQTTIKLKYVGGKVNVNIRVEKKKT